MGAHLLHGLGAGNALAALDLRQRFVDQGLRPGKIIAGSDLADGKGDRLLRRLEGARVDLTVDPVLNIRWQLHAQSYHIGIELCTAVVALILWAAAGWPGRENLV
jgi:hypothetical protein